MPRLYFVGWQRQGCSMSYPSAMDAPLDVEMEAPPMINPSKIAHLPSGKRCMRAQKLWVEGATVIQATLGKPDASLTEAERAAVVEGLSSMAVLTVADGCAHGGRWRAGLPRRLRCAVA